MMRRQNKKDAVNFDFNTDFIRRVISEEYKSVMKSYNENHDPFYGWVVGNLVEKKIKTFLVEKHGAFRKKSVSGSTDSHNQLALSFFFEAFHELILPKEGKHSSPKKSVEKASTVIFPENPADFSVQHWRMLRKKYEEKMEENAKIFHHDTLSEIQETKNPPEVENQNAEFEKEKFIEENIRQKKRGEKLRNNKENQPVKHATRRINKTGADLNEDTTHGDDIQVNIEFKLNQKEIVDLEKYGALISDELTQRGILPGAGKRLRIRQVKQGLFRFQLFYFGSKTEYFTEKMLKDEIMPDLEGYLSGKYLDVEMDLQTHYQDEIPVLFLIAYFSLDAVKVRVSQLEELYFVRNDERYIDI